MLGVLSSPSGSAKPSPLPPLTPRAWPCEYRCTSAGVEGWLTLERRFACRFTGVRDGTCGSEGAVGVGPPVCATAPGTGEGVGGGDRAEEGMNGLESECGKGCRWYAACSEYVCAPNCTLEFASTRPVAYGGACSSSPSY